MKVLWKFVAAIVLFTMIVSCGGAPATVAPTEAPVTGATEPPATEVPLSEAEQWAKDNGLGIYTPAEEDWAAIEAAAIQEGKVVVYSNSSRISNIADAWAAQYPEITLEAYDMGTDAEVTKIREEQQAGVYTGDVSMASGSFITEEFVPNQYIWKYIPPELLPVLPIENQNPVVTHSLETYGWVYNTQLNTSCPITNWWQATEEAWRGKIAINKDPVTSGSDIAMLASAAKHADELAAAYLALYGRDWTTDAAYGTDTPDAGWLWLKKLAQNQLIAGSDEAWSVMGAPGMTENILGLFWYSKYRKVLDGEAFFAPCEGLSPVVGLQKHNYLSILNHAPHPNAAKLYIQFALSAEGVKPWNTVGQVSGRTDIPPVDAQLPFLNLPIWYLDDAFVYAHGTEYHDFYALKMLTP